MAPACVIVTGVMAGWVFSVRDGAMYMLSGAAGAAEAVELAVCGEQSPSLPMTAVEDRNLAAPLAIARPR